MIDATQLDATLLDADWIVCLGVTRQVMAGRVECPHLAGLRVDARGCEGCRHMAWRHDERDRRPSCSTPAEVS